MATMTRELLSNAFDEALAEVTIGSMGDEPQLWAQLFTMRPMSGAQFTRAVFGDLSEFQAKTESAEMVEDSLEQIAKQTLVATTYGKILKCTDELLEDQDWIGITDFGLALGQKGAELYETKAALFFDNISTTTYHRDEMGEAVAASTHTDQNGNTITGYDNLSALAFSFANACTVRAASRRFPGYATAQKTTVLMDEMLIPPELEDVAFALLNSQLIPGSVNNDANPFRTGWRVYAWNYLADTNRWHMMDSRRRRRCLQAHLRTPLEILYDAVWSQKIRKIGAYLRFVFGATDGRFIHTSEPS